MPPLPVLPGMSAPAAPPAAAPAAPPAGSAPSGLDPTIVNLAKAIRQTETRGQADPYTAKGGSGEYGAYQYTEGTWNADAKKYLGTAVPLSSATKLQQNEVAYKKLADLKAAGNNVGQIASIWNSGSPEWEGKVGVNSHGVKYDVPQYVNSVADAYQALKSGQEPNYQDTASTVGKEQVVTQAQQADDASAAQSGAFSPAVTGDSELSAGLKTAGNLLPSAFNFAKGAVQSLNPINIVKNLAAIPGAFQGLVQESGGIGNALAATAKELPGVAYDQLMPKAAKELIAGDIEGAQRDVTNDPVGSVAPFVFAAEGGVKALDKAGITADAAGALDRGISTAAKPVTAPVGYAFGKAADMAAGTAKYATAKATGFNADTISEITQHPDAFTPEAMANASRASLGSTVGDALQGRIDTLDDTGAGYADIRKSTAPVKVDVNTLGDALGETTGLVLKKGKFTPTAKSFIDQPADVARIQRFYDAWQPYFKKGTMTPDDFLTMRSKLAKVAYNDAGLKSGDMSSVAARTRGSLNTALRDQIKGLPEQDADFASQSQELALLRKGLLDKNGNLTDTAVNRIANAGGKGKDALLGRLEQISPGITLKIRQLKAVEDIQNIHKVGTYVKSTIEGGGLVGGIATANIPLIAASIAALLLTQPEVAVRMIRGYGKYAVPIARAVADVLKKGGSAVNNLPKAGAVQVGAFSPKQPALTQ